MPRELYTIGHSNHPLDVFLKLVAGAGIRLVADVRRFPGSRRHPHFNGDALSASLAGIGVGYRHFAAMGGRRGAREVGSPNTGWRVAAFNAFADHMNTPEFLESLAELESLATSEPAVIMCSEAMPWQCHRRLIADALTARGWCVRDLMGSGRVAPHRPTEFLRVVGGRLTYPAEPLMVETGESLRTEG